jgi:ABC-type lipoprotein release transport system permease subunit
MINDASAGALKNTVGDYATALESSKTNKTKRVALLPNYIALAILAAIVPTVIHTLLPARRAARLNRVDVMRST